MNALVAIPDGKRPPVGFALIDLNQAVELTNKAVEHVVRDLPEGRRISASRPWGINRAEVEPKTEQPKRNWVRENQSAFTASECGEIDAELGIVVPLEVHHENVQATAARSDDLAGGPLAGWFIGRLRERTEDGGRRSRAFVVAQFRAWRPLLCGLGDGRHARAFMDSRISASPEPDDAILLRLAESRDLQEYLVWLTIPAEFRNAKFDRATWRQLSSSPPAVAC